MLKNAPRIPLTFVVEVRGALLPDDLIFEKFKNVTKG
jgi:hypothetical protein